MTVSSVKKDVKSSLTGNVTRMQVTRIAVQVMKSVKIVMTLVG